MLLSLLHGEPDEGVRLKLAIPGDSLPKASGLPKVGTGHLPCVPANPTRLVHFWVLALARGLVWTGASFFVLVLSL